MPRRPTVMVVEDEDDLRELFASFLKDEYNVITAANGQAALEKLDPRIDVILLDRLLPDTRGGDLLKQISKTGDYGIAMVTAVQPGMDIVEMGIHEYLTKPVSRDELLETVKQLVRIQSYDEKLSELLSLARKQAVLQEGHDESTLEENPEFDRLRVRLEKTRTELDDFDDDFLEGDSELLFNELF